MNVPDPGLKLNLCNRYNGACYSEARLHRGPLKCYVTPWGCVSFPGKKHYEGERFNVITVTN